MKNMEQQLRQVLLNQTIIYKKLCKLEDKAKGTTKSQSDKQYAADLQKEADKLSEDMNSEPGQFDVYR